MMPLLILVSGLVLIAWTVTDAIRLARRPAQPEDGCCGCGADLSDAMVGALKGRSEGYCSKCLDEWPADAGPLNELGVLFFPGRDRSI